MQKEFMFGYCGMTANRDYTFKEKYYYYKTIGHDLQLVKKAE